LEKIGEIWKEFEKMNKLSPILAFYLKPLRNGSQLKSVYQKLTPFHRLFSTGPHFKTDELGGRI